MTQPWIRMLNVTAESFPIEVFGYPEASDEIIFHVTLTSPTDGAAVPPLPKQRMRMKIVLTTGEVLIGEERQ